MQRPTRVCLLCRPIQGTLKNLSFYFIANTIKCTRLCQQREACITRRSNGLDPYVQKPVMGYNPDGTQFLIPANSCNAEEETSEKEQRARKERKGRGECSDEENRPRRK